MIKGKEANRLYVVGVFLLHFGFTVSAYVKV